MDLNKLTSILPKDIDGCVIKSPSNRFYFSGSNIAEGTLIVTAKGSVYLTDSRYIEQARLTITCCDVVELKDESAQLPSLLKKFNCSNVAVEGEYLTIAGLKGLAKALNPDGIKIIYDMRLDKLIKYLRRVKSTHETESIRSAQGIAEAALDNALRHIKPGMTEKEIALALDFFMLRNGAEAVSFDTIVVSGKNSSKPHGVPTDKKIENGDFITMDFGAVVDGYHSDMTRTVAVGRISDFQSKVYSVVLEAQLKAIEAALPGARCADVDAAARSVIEKEGFGKAFSHSVGHGVGLEIHEEPVVSSKSTAQLQTGNIITVEPGIYLPDQFGVRIEDMLYITANGNANLTKAPKKLTVLNN